MTIKRRRKNRSRRGRPAGEPKVQVGLRLPPEQKRDLKILHQVLDGRPSVGGLIQTAVERFVEDKLSEPGIRQAYDRFLDRDLRVVS